MLMVTESARQAIESIVSSAEMPQGSGLRIDTGGQPEASTNSSAPLQLAVASEPAEEDQVVSQENAKVFISSTVAPALDDKVLDARVTEGQIQFVIAPQQGR